MSWYLGASCDSEHTWTGASAETKAAIVLSTHLVMFNGDIINAGSGSSLLGEKFPLQYKIISHQHIKKRKIKIQWDTGRKISTNPTWKNLSSTTEWWHTLSKWKLNSSYQLLSIIYKGVWSSLTVECLSICKQSCEYYCQEAKKGYPTLPLSWCYGAKYSQLNATFLDITDGCSP